ncbi:putative membrane protein [Mycetocola sp. BIGb0189]|uniref:YhgE/Pip domain-containing protein n=1 Tax=Mycetocola sp. BIGb0189 TaxID=2940604 RepID=UPI002167E5DD|nr:YhgE/Pip domain-containing protein [Mycetocola sp. BIGb0189]MCS4276628.1 putative membrane protein [Mycetocola sp. BIGb0189]
MIAAFSPGSDFKRYYRGTMPRLALLVILIMPLMYGALYLWAFWNPFGNVDKVPVAIVNLDTGADAGKQRIHAGPQVVKGLIDSKQLNLIEVSEEEAKTGLSHGKYDFTITIPADFSTAIASVSGDNPRSADLIFTYDETNNYLSTVIGQDAAEEVINQVSAQVGSQVFEAALDGAKGAIPKLIQAANGVDTLNSGMQQANQGAQELATNLVTAKDGSDKLAGAVDEIVTGLDGIIGKAQGLVQGSGISGAEVRSAVQRIDAGVNTAATLLNDAAATQQKAAQDLDAVIADLRAKGEGGLADQIQGVRNSIAANPQVAQANTTIAEVRRDTNLLAGQLNSPGTQFNVVLQAIENDQVVGDLNKARSGADQLRSGADQLRTGLGELSAGANTLAEGTPKLAAGTEQLAEAAKTGLSLIPKWGKDQERSVIQTLAEPVKLVEKTEHEAKTFAYGFAPFFLGLALFVGSIIAWMLFTPLQARPLAQGLGSFRTVLASFMPTLAVGGIQGTILFLVIYFGLGLKPEYPIGTLAFMWLMSAMFLAMIQMLNALFGAAVGRVATLALLMVMLTSAGGIYPVQTTSPLFQWLHPFDPMTYTVTGLRQLIMGGIDYRFGVALAVIGALTLVFLAVSTWAARRNRQYNMDRLYPPIEV